MRIEIKAAIVGGLIGAISSFLISYSGIFVDYSIKYSSNAELAYHQVVRINEILRNNSLDENQIPIEKLMLEDSDWSYLFIEAKDDSFAEIYLKILQLDELRENILNSQDTIEKNKLISEYWTLFKQLSKDSKIYELERGLNQIRNEVRNSIDDNANKRYLQKQIKLIGE